MLKSKKLLISLISAAFLLLAICVGAINVRAAEGLVLKYDDQEVTEIALTVGQRNVDVYYVIDGSEEYNEELTIVPSDDTLISVSKNTSRNRFRLNPLAVGEVTLTVTAGSYSSELLVKISYEEPATVKLTYPGETAAQTITIETELTLNYSDDGFAVTEQAVNSNGLAGTYDTANLAYEWVFEENTCNASFKDGMLYVGGVGTSKVSVWATISGERKGEPKEFTLTSQYQRVASDLNAVANGIEITGIVYDAGSDKVILRYEEETEAGESAVKEQEVALSELVIDYTAGNRKFIDPAGIVWDSTNANVVKVEGNKIVFNTDSLNGSQYFTLTVHDTINTVADNVMVIINKAATETEEPEGGCGGVVAGSAAGIGILITAAALSVLALKRKQKN